MAGPGASDPSKSPSDSPTSGFLGLLSGIDHPLLNPVKGRVEKMTPDAMAKLDRLFKILGEGLKSGNMNSLVGGIVALLTEYFGSPKDKKETEDARETAKKEVDAKKQTQGDLNRLRADVEGKKEEGPKKKAAELVMNPELPDGKDIVVIGDSIGHGWPSQFAEGQRPSFIGGDGLSTGEVLHRLQASTGTLKGRKKAIIHCAANNILGSSTERLVQHMADMVKLCSEAGIPEIIITSQFPPMAKYVSMVGQEKFADLKKRQQAFLQALKDAKSSGRFPASVRIVDLTTPFANEKGEMKETFVDSKAEDNIHPRKAYKAALHYILTEGSEES